MHISKKTAAIAGPPIFLCHETSPAAVQEANEKGTAVVEVAWPVNELVKGTNEIIAYVLPGGRMAHVIHKGPYDTCEPTYLALFAWITEKGLTTCGPVRDIYPNDPLIVSLEEIITDIYVPVRQPSHFFGCVRSPGQFTRQSEAITRQPGAGA